MTDYQSTIADAFLPIEKNVKHFEKIYPNDISKLIRQSNKIYIRDTGIRYIDPETKHVYVHYGCKGILIKEDMSNEYKELFFGNI